MYLFHCLTLFEILLQVNSRKAQAFFVGPEFHGIHFFPSFLKINTTSDSIFPSIQCFFSSFPLCLLRNWPALTTKTTFENHRREEKKTHNENAHTKRQTNVWLNCREKNITRCTIWKHFSFRSLSLRTRNVPTPMRCVIWFPFNVSIFSFLYCLSL